MILLKTLWGKEENFPTMFSILFQGLLTFSQISDSPKLKEFAGDNFKFDKNGREFSKQVENTAGKEEIAHYEQFLFFR